MTTRRRNWSVGQDSVKTLFNDVVVPRVDSIQEDFTGNLWIFSLGKERRIFKFSPELTLLEHFRIESPREISKILDNGLRCF